MEPSSPVSEGHFPPAYGRVELEWQAPEHEPFELGPKTRVIAIVLLIAIIAYALITNSPLMAITFILIGVVGYLALEREPRLFRFAVTTKGIIAGPHLYAYDDLISYHLYDEPPFDNLLSLKTTGKLIAHVHIPIHTVSVRELEQTLDDYLPEEKHRPSLVDTLERFLHS